jgi:hypothetical protein
MPRWVDKWFSIRMGSRRKFIFDCSTAIAAFSLLPMGSFGISAISGGSCQSLDQMSYSVLTAQINTLFRVRLSAFQAVELKLLKAPLAPQTPITLGRRLPGDAGCEKFSLIFSGPKDEMIGSAIHQFEHEQLGRFEMFIGRIGMPEADSVRYEAGFNRPAPSGMHTQKLT